MDAPWFRRWQRYGLCCRNEAEGGPRIQNQCSLSRLETDSQCLLSGREFHPPKSSAVHGALLRSHPSHWLMMGTMKHHEIPPTVRPYGRLKLVGAGLALAIVGSALLLRGVQVVTHWTGQPMFSWGLIAAGGLCVLLAVIPASWIAKAAATDSKAARHR